MFSWEFCKISESNFFTEHLRVTVSVTPLVESLVSKKFKSQKKFEKYLCVKMESHKWYHDFNEEQNEICKIDLANIFDL